MLLEANDGANDSFQRDARISHVTLDQLAIKEIPDSSFVTCGIAVSEDDKWARRNLVAERYLREGYIGRDDPDLRSGAFYDRWEDVSIPLVAKRGAEVSSSLRMIRNTSELGLPINHLEGGARMFSVDSEFDTLVANAPFEVSQLAKPYTTQANSDYRSTLAVLRGFFAVMDAEQKEYAVAVIDSRVIKLLNGDFLHLGLKPIGESQYYMGSPSTPVYINRLDVVDNARESKNPFLADFLDGKKSVEGFEWYKGV